MDTAASCQASVYHGGKIHRSIPGRPSVNRPLLTHSLPRRLPKSPPRSPTPPHRKLQPHHPLRPKNTEGSSRAPLPLAASACIPTPQRTINSWLSIKPTRLRCNPPTPLAISPSPLAMTCSSSHSTHRRHTTSVSPLNRMPVNRPTNGRCLRPRNPTLANSVTRVSPTPRTRRYETTHPSRRRPTHRPIRTTPRRATGRVRSTRWTRSPRHWPD
jgi:hypothetical protein